MEVQEAEGRREGAVGEEAEGAEGAEGAEVVHHNHEGQSSKVLEWSTG